MLYRSVFPLLLCAAFAACDATYGPGPMVDEPMVLEETIDADGTVRLEAPPLAPVHRPVQRTPRSRVLTAGDIDDGLNLAAYQRFQAEAARELSLPSAGLTRPVLAQLVTAAGTPAPGVRVTLRRPGASKPFFDGYSGVDGHITVFPTVFRQVQATRVELRAFPGGNGQPVIQEIEVGPSRPIIPIPGLLPGQSGWSPDFLDLVFVVDTTGSMGDELDWLTRDLLSITRQAQRAAPGVDIRYGLIVYRDQGDEYVAKNLGFTKSATTMRAWLRRQSADGGGDYPEAADTALRASNALAWRRGKGERLLFHVADAPPHRDRTKAYIEAAHDLTRKGVQIFGLGASGVGPEAEYVMRQAAAMSNGRYLFLTDDSGVGQPHSEPRISCYRVTDLNGLMVRVLKSELTGIRLEADEADVVRTVGSYRRGVCLN